MENWSEYSRFFTALLVILDPFMAMPILLVLTEGFSDEQHNRIARITTFTVTLVLVVRPDR